MPSTCALCMKHKLPMMPINHMEAHALTARLVIPVQFPFLLLLIYGGHCLLALAKGIDQYELLGSSIDDSPGEALELCTHAEAAPPAWYEGHGGREGGGADCCQG